MYLLVAPSDLNKLILSRLRAGISSRNGPLLRNISMSICTLFYSRKMFFVRRFCGVVVPAFVVRVPLGCNASTQTLADSDCSTSIRTSSKVLLLVQALLTKEKYKSRHYRHDPASRAAGWRIESVAASISCQELISATISRQEFFLHDPTSRLQTALLGCVLIQDAGIER